MLQLGHRVTNCILSFFLETGDEPPALNMSLLDLEIHHRLTQEQQYAVTSDGLHNIHHHQDGTASDQGFHGHQGLESASASGTHGSGLEGNNPHGQESFFFPHTVPQFYIRWEDGGVL